MSAKTIDFIGGFEYLPHFYIRIGMGKTEKISAKNGKIAPTFSAKCKKATNIYMIED